MKKIFILLFSFILVSCGFDTEYNNVSYIFADSIYVSGIELVDVLHTRGCDQHHYLVRFSSTPECKDIIFVYKTPDSVNVYECEYKLGDVIKLKK